MARKAAEAGYRAFYSTAADLVAKTNKAALEGRWQTTMRFWNGPQFGDPRAGLPAVAGRGGRASVSGHQPPLRDGLDRATTNRGIADCGEIFEDTVVASAILDRLLHHATVIAINGDSYRMRRHHDHVNSIHPRSPAATERTTPPARQPVAIACRAPSAVADRCYRKFVLPRKLRRGIV